MEKNQLRVIISGGGTGGHIFPAISIANALREINPDVKILFVGALGRMEMERVPHAGYEIVGLPVAGFQRKLTLKNVSFFFKLFKSMRLARKIIFDFKPSAVVGVGGYASGPVLNAAQRFKIPTLIQEQNSYAGVTNKMLAAKACKICVAYDGMEKYFPAERILKTGNPVRQDLENLTATRDEALKYFDISTNQRVILILGGSLGARSVNQNIIANVPEILSYNDITVIWQTGKIYHSDIKQQLTGYSAHNIRLFDFIDRMDYAFAAADVVITRAGAGTISELCLVGKPAVLVPSPNVAEDHQTHNAQALVKNNAAVMVPDSRVKEDLLKTAILLVTDEFRLKELSANILKMALPNSARIIANEVLKLTDNE